MSIDQVAELLYLLISPPTITIKVRVVVDLLHI